MSSFMCSNETLMSIAMYLYDRYSKWFVEYHDDMFIEPIDIYRDLHHLNVRALVQRYGEKAVEDMAYDPIDDLTDVEFFKLTPEEGFPLYARLRCYLYQCTEGDAVKTDLYNFLTREVEPALATSLLDNIMRITGFKWSDYAY